MRIALFWAWKVELLVVQDVLLPAFGPLEIGKDVNRPINSAISEEVDKCGPFFSGFFDPGAATIATKNDDWITYSSLQFSYRSRCGFCAICGLAAN